MHNIILSDLCRGGVPSESFLEQNSVHSRVDVVREVMIEIYNS